MKHNDHTIKKCYELAKAITRLFRHDTQVLRGPDGAIHYDDIIEECRKKEYIIEECTKKEFINAPHWSIDKWISVLAKGGGEKKRFQYCLNPNSPRQFLYFRAIQGHSGRSIIDPPLQDNVLLPEGFTEYIYHVEKANDFFRNGLIA